MLSEGKSGRISSCFLSEKHKTGIKGPAWLMLTSRDLPRLQSYGDFMRPVTDPESRLDKQLILAGPKELANNIHALIQAMA